VEFNFIQATALDRDYLLSLRKLTMVEHLQKAGLFLTEQEHQQRLDENYVCSHIVQYQGLTIGTLKYQQTASGVEIMQLQIHPDHQNQGFGKAILQQVIANAQGKKILLRVLKDNPALQLYLRLGFKVVGEDDDEYHLQTQSDNLQIRTYCEGDAGLLRDLFFNTVRLVNAADYQPQQLSAWAPESYDVVAWNEKMAANKPFIAELNGIIVAYADLQTSGLIDHFFCHHAYQGLGIGKALMEHVLTVGQNNGLSRIYSAVSITAKPFYQGFGFVVVKQQSVEIRGQYLTNYLMEKYL
jgi:putative acetyltransferase